MTYSLYILKHPHTEETVYVGLTTNIKSRHQAHRINYKKKFGFVPLIDVLMTFSNHKIGTSVEKATIESLRKIFTLSNSIRYTPGLRATVSRQVIAATLTNDLIAEINEIRKSDRRSFSLMVALLIAEALQNRKLKSKKTEKQTPA